MNETLTVKDFGPIREATVEFKRVTVFIGPTGGGKSTLAKLAAIYRKSLTEDNLLFDKVGDKFIGESFGVSSYHIPQTFIAFTTAEGRIIPISVKPSSVNQPEVDVIGQLAEAAFERYMKESGLEIADAVTNVYEKIEKPFNRDVHEDLRQVFMSTFKNRIASNVAAKLKFVHNCVYIPSERIFYAAISFSLAGLMRDDINLPKPLLVFVNDFSGAKKEVTDVELPIFDVKYEQRNGDDYIRVPGREKPLYLHETASGIQSVAPLLVLLEHLSRQTERPQSFIIEEPELNLYPEAQQALLNILVEKCAKADGKNDLIITTHSPYVLASCNLLLEAWKVWEKRPDLEQEIAAIVPRASWINPAEFAAYHVADGTVKPITDERTHLLGANELDAVSGDIADAFRKLLRLSKQQPAADA